MKYHIPFISMWNPGDFVPKDAKVFDCFEGGSFLITRALDVEADSEEEAKAKAEAILRDEKKPGV